MPGDDVPVGRRFSHVYLGRGEPTQDSVRFRRRLIAFIYQYKALNLARGRIAEVIHRELGVDIPSRLNHGSDFRDFFDHAEIRDVLDSITVIWTELYSMGLSTAADEWRDFVQRAINEENLGYRLDEKSGVHYLVDEEFERNRLATVQHLDNPRYGAVRAEFESAYEKLSQVPPDTKEAIRAVFEAMEILTKLMIGSNKVTRLGSAAVEKYLKPMLKSAYTDDEVALKAANQFLSGLSDWINAAHVYRHGQEVEEPAEPPVDLAVAMVSSGTAYLRWLVRLDLSSNQ